MEEFLKIDWHRRDLETIARTHNSITEEDLMNSYVYASFESDLNISNPIISKELPIQKKFVPGLSIFKRIPINSLLNTKQHSLCLSALKVYQSGRANLSEVQKMNLELYNELKWKIEKENKLFLEHVKANWQKKKNKWNVNSNFIKFWKNNLQKSMKVILNYPQYYVHFDTVSFSYSDEHDEPVEMIPIQNVLELGTIAKFSAPSLKSRCVFKHFKFPITDANVNSKLAVSADNNIIELIKANDIDVVVSSGGLTRLLHFTDNNDWDIPVTIKYIDVNNTNKKRKVVFIDKPFHKRTIDSMEISHYAQKRLLKTNFCKCEAFTFPNTEAILSLSDSDSLKENSEKVTDENDTSKNTCQKSDLDLNIAKSNIIHHNVSYRIWHLKQKDQHNLMKSAFKNKTIKVLVRCKIDACEIAENNTLQPTSLYPKVEDQLEYGGTILTKSELIKQWSLLFFRPFSILYRFRISNRTSEVILIENCNLHKINNEALYFHEYKPNLGLGVLYKVFSHLTNVDTGMYLMQRKSNLSPFLNLLKETTSETENTYDLYSKYNPEEIITNQVQNWRSIDVNLILPAHEEYQQMPGLFKPYTIKKVFKKGKKCKWKPKAQRKTN